MNLSKIVSKLPSTKKYKLICSPNNFYNLSLKSRYPNAKKMESMKIYSSENVEKIPPAELKQIILDSNLL